MSPLPSFLDPSPKKRLEVSLLVRRKDVPFDNFDSPEQNLTEYP